MEKSLYLIEKEKVGFKVVQLDLFKRILFGDTYLVEYVLYNKLERKIELMEILYDSIIDVIEGNDLVLNSFNSTSTSIKITIHNPAFIEMQKQIIIYALEHKFILNYIYNIEKIQRYYVVYTGTLGKGKVGFY